MTADELTTVLGARTGQYRTRRPAPRSPAARRTAAEKTAARGSAVGSSPPRCSCHRAGRSAINMLGGEGGEVHVPNVVGQTPAQAAGALQDAGFRPGSHQARLAVRRIRSSAPTRPRASWSDAGDKITIKVSTGPEQREIPDVATLSYAEAVKKLTIAGFGRSKQSPSRRRRAEGPGGRDAPAGQQLGDHRTRITLNVGTGSQTGARRQVGKTEQTARDPQPGRVHQHRPSRWAAAGRRAGQVFRTDPTAAASSRSTPTIPLFKSQCKQYPMPDPRRQPGPTPSHACGRGLDRGPLDRGADARDSGQRTTRW